MKCLAVVTLLLALEAIRCLPNQNDKLHRQIALQSRQTQERGELSVVNRGSNQERLIDDHDSNKFRKSQTGDYQTESEAKTADHRSYGHVNDNSGQPADRQHINRVNNGQSVNGLKHQYDLNGEYANEQYNFGQHRTVIEPKLPDQLLNRFQNDRIRNVQYVKGTENHGEAGSYAGNEYHNSKYNTYKSNIGELPGVYAPSSGQIEYRPAEVNSQNVPANYGNINFALESGIPLYKPVLHNTATAYNQELNIGQHVSEINTHHNNFKNNLNAKTGDYKPNTPHLISNENQRYNPVIVDSTLNSGNDKYIGDSKQNKAGHKRAAPTHNIPETGINGASYYHSESGHNIHIPNHAALGGRMISPGSYDEILKYVPVQNSNDYIHIQAENGAPIRTIALKDLNNEAGLSESLIDEIYRIIQGHPYSSRMINPGIGSNFETVYYNGNDYGSGPVNYKLGPATIVETGFVPLGLYYEPNSGNIVPLQSTGGKKPGNGVVPILPDGTVNPEYEGSKDKAVIMDQAPKDLIDKGSGHKNANAGKKGKVFNVTDTKKIKDNFPYSEITTSDESFVIDKGIATTVINKNGSNSNKSANINNNTDSSVKDTSSGDEKGLGSKSDDGTDSHKSRKITGNKSTTFASVSEISTTDAYDKSNSNGYHDSNFSVNDGGINDKKKYRSTVTIEKTSDGLYTPTSTETSNLGGHSDGTGDDGTKSPVTEKSLKKNNSRTTLHRSHKHKPVKPARRTFSKPKNQNHYTQRTDATSDHSGTRKPSRALLSSRVTLKSTKHVDHTNDINKKMNKHNTCDITHDTSDKSTEASSNENSTDKVSTLQTTEGSHKSYNSPTYTETSNLGGENDVTDDDTSKSPVTEKSNKSSRTHWRQPHKHIHRNPARPESRSTDKLRKPKRQPQGSYTNKGPKIVKNSNTTSDNRDWTHEHWDDISEDYTSTTSSNSNKNAKDDTSDESTEASSNESSTDKVSTLQTTEGSDKSYNSPTSTETSNLGDESDDTDEDTSKSPVTEISIEPSRTHLRQPHKRIQKNPAYPESRVIDKLRHPKRQPQGSYTTKGPKIVKNSNTTSDNKAWTAEHWDDISEDYTSTTSSDSNKNAKDDTSDKSTEASSNENSTDKVSTLQTTEGSHKSYNSPTYTETSNLGGENDVTDDDTSKSPVTEKSNKSSRTHWRQPHKHIYRNPARPESRSTDKLRKPKRQPQGSYTNKGPKIVKNSNTTSDNRDWTHEHWDDISEDYTSTTSSDSNKNAKDDTSDKSTEASSNENSTDKVSTLQTTEGSDKSYNSPTSTETSNLGDESDDTDDDTSKSPVTEKSNKSSRTHWRQPHKHKHRNPARPESRSTDKLRHPKRQPQGSYTTKGPKIVKNSNTTSDNKAWTVEHWDDISEDYTSTTSSDSNKNAKDDTSDKSTEASSNENSTDKVSTLQTTEGSHKSYNSPTYTETSNLGGENDVTDDDTSKSPVTEKSNKSSRTHWRQPHKHIYRNPARPESRSTDKLRKPKRQPQGSYTNKGPKIVKNSNTTSDNRDWTHEHWDDISEDYTSTTSSDSNKNAKDDTSDKSTEASSNENSTDKVSTLQTTEGSDKSYNSPTSTETSNLGDESDDTDDDTSKSPVTEKSNKSSRTHWRQPHKHKHRNPARPESRSTDKLRHPKRQPQGSYTTKGPKIVKNSNTTSDNKAWTAEHWDDISEDYTSTTSSDSNKNAKDDTSDKSTEVSSNENSTDKVSTLQTTEGSHKSYNSPTYTETSNLGGENDVTDDDTSKSPVTEKSNKSSRTHWRQPHKHIYRNPARPESRSTDKLRKPKRQPQGSYTNKGPKIVKNSNTTSDNRDWTHEHWDDISEDYTSTTSSDSNKNAKDDTSDKSTEASSNENSTDKVSTLQTTEGSDKSYNSPTSTETSNLGDESDDTDDDTSKSPVTEKSNKSSRTHWRQPHKHIYRNPARPESRSTDKLRKPKRQPQGSYTNKGPKIVKNSNTTSDNRDWTHEHWDDISEDYTSTTSSDSNKNAKDDTSDKSTEASSNENSTDKVSTLQTTEGSDKSYNSPTSTETSNLGDESDDTDEDTSKSPVTEISIEPSRTHWRQPHKHKHRNPARPESRSTDALRKPKHQPQGSNTMKIPKNVNNSNTTSNRSGPRKPTRPTHTQPRLAVKPTKRFGHTTADVNKKPNKSNKNNTDNDRDTFGKNDMIKNMNLQPFGKNQPDDFSDTNRNGNVATTDKASTDKHCADISEDTTTTTSDNNKNAKDDTSDKSRETTDGSGRSDATSDVNFKSPVTEKFKTTHSSKINTELLNIQKLKNHLHSKLGLHINKLTGTGHVKHSNTTLNHSVTHEPISHDHSKLRVNFHKSIESDKSKTVGDGTLSDHKHELKNHHHLGLRIYKSKHTNKFKIVSYSNTDSNHTVTPKSNVADKSGTTSYFRNKTVKPKNHHAEKSVFNFTNKIKTGSYKESANTEMETGKNHSYPTSFGPTDDDSESKKSPNENELAVISIKLQKGMGSLKNNKLTNDNVPGRNNNEAIEKLNKDQDSDAVNSDKPASKPEIPSNIKYLKRRPARESDDKLSNKNSHETYKKSDDDNKRTVNNRRSEDSTSDWTSVAETSDRPELKDDSSIKSQIKNTKKKKINKQKQKELRSSEKENNSEDTSSYNTHKNRALHKFKKHTTNYNKDININSQMESRLKSTINKSTSGNSGHKHLRGNNNGAIEKSNEKPESDAVNSNKPGYNTANTSNIKDLKRRTDRKSKDKNNRETLKKSGNTRRSEDSTSDLTSGADASNRSELKDDSSIKSLIKNTKKKKISKHKKEELRSSEEENNSEDTSSYNTHKNRALHKFKKHTTNYNKDININSQMESRLKSTINKSTSGNSGHKHLRGNNNGAIEKSNEKPESDAVNSNKPGYNTANTSNIKDLKRRTDRKSKDKNNRETLKKSDNTRGSEDSTSDLTSGADASNRSELKDDSSIKSLIKNTKKKKISKHKKEELRSSEEENNSEDTSSYNTHKNRALHKFKKHTTNYSKDINNNAQMDSRLKLTINESTSGNSGHEHLRGNNNGAIEISNEKQDSDAVNSNKPGPYTANTSNIKDLKRRTDRKSKHKNNREILKKSENTRDSEDSTSGWTSDSDASNRSEHTKKKKINKQKQKVLRSSEEENNSKDTSSHNTHKNRPFHKSNKEIDDVGQTQSHLKLSHHENT